MLVLLFAFSHIIVNACNPGPKPNFNRAGFDFDCWALCSPLLIHLSSPGNPVSYPSVAGAKPHQQTHFCEFWAWKLHLVGTKPGLFLCSASWFRLTEWVRLTPSTPWLQACNQSDWLNDRVRFFEAWPGLTSSGRFRVVFLLFPEQKFRVFIVPEQPVTPCRSKIVLAQLCGNRCGGEMSGVSQSDVLFTIDGFQASW